MLFVKIRNFSGKRGYSCKWAPQAVAHRIDTCTCGMAHAHIYTHQHYTLPHLSLRDTIESVRHAPPFASAFVPHPFAQHRRGGSARARDLRLSYTLLVPRVSCVLCMLCGSRSRAFTIRSELVCARSRYVICALFTTPTLAHIALVVLNYELATACGRRASYH